MASHGKPCRSGPSRATRQRRIVRTSGGPGIVAAQYESFVTYASQQQVAHRRRLGVFPVTGRNVLVGCRLFRRR
ncbi:hypothetical protein RALTA_B1851 [Cupriavidus taiwanensis LMG 19424]|uniref:Uncharacterized protein n=2 Tax=Cupriavidus taiwanensis TaxID=164546 RepID=B3RC09_CUPTR|nr:hypothetical protein RALTA_B1851 [Cupriavidus taiwanensis LMG 19424]SOZ08596.1 hypothetical protein CBM2597_B10400 [Cupriavidus taiwanensis]SOZ10931.1 hypothetical protein CBM2595_B10126 [Cupriavidus taiwanensis]SOZ42256.1 hypothetical protein CBM2598_B10650 [Cupriavidus taiwanensis]SPC20507.1 conserved hypothetical protein [Cupriavidus taiwanensis]